MDRYLIETPHTEQNCRDLVDLVNAAGYLHQSNESPRHGQTGPSRQSSTPVSDTSQFCPTVLKAVSCHKTQMSIYKNLEHLSAENHKAIWGTQEFYRAFSLVNGGRARESDLFEGLR